MSSETVSFADVVRERREGAGLTQLDVAQRSGLSRAAIEHLESGERRDPYVSTIVKLAAGLGIEPSELLSPFAVNP